MGVRSIAAGIVFVVACACAPKKPPAVGEGSGTGSAGGSGTSAASCDGVKAPVTALYEAEAKATDQANHDPTFVDDNVAMVMKDCAKDPAKVAPCAAAAKDVAGLERDCLIPLDEEGREGEELGK